jgi:hypothetical protein
MKRSFRLLKYCLLVFSFIAKRLVVDFQRSCPLLQQPCRELCKSQPFSGKYDTKPQPSSSVIASNQHTDHPVQEMPSAAQSLLWLLSLALERK